MKNLADAKENINGHSSKGGRPMWGYPLSFWESIFFWTAGIAAVLGGLSVLCAFLSSIIGYRVTDAIQRESNERIAIAEQRAAEANQKAEEERLARMKIEEKLAPRSLSKLQMDTLSDRMRQFSGISIQMYVYGDVSPDILPLSGQIRSALNSAGWQTSCSSVIGGTRQVVGIIVKPRNTDETAGAAAICLVEELNSQGIYATKEILNPNSYVTMAAIVMEIGIKP